MNYIKTALDGVYIIEPKIFGDNRGYFFESFRQDEFEKNISKISFVQDNESKSSYGVLRGLHYQKPPYTQSKLIRVVKGVVLDIAVDVRKYSPTFGKHIGVELSEDNHRQLFIPRGFAHGFVVLLVHGDVHVDDPQPEPVLRFQEVLDGHHFRGSAPLDLRPDDIDVGYDPYKLLVLINYRQIPDTISEQDTDRIADLHRRHDTYCTAFHDLAHRCIRTIGESQKFFGCDETQQVSALGYGETVEV